MYFVYKEAKNEREDDQPAAAAAPATGIGQPTDTLCAHCNQSRKRLTRHKKFFGTGDVFEQVGELWGCTQHIKRVRLEHKRQTRQRPSASANATTAADTAADTTSLFDPAASPVQVVDRWGRKRPEPCSTDPRSTRRRQKRKGVAAIRFWSAASSKSSHGTRIMTEIVGISCREERRRGWIHAIACVA